MQSPPIEPRDLSHAMRRDGSPILAEDDGVLEFGRFRVLLRQRQLLADGIPVGLGTRAFDLMMVLLEADGALVTKDELLRRVWPGIVVAEDNLKVQISALRKALGEDRDFIRTDFGRGYRCTAVVRWAIATSAEDLRLAYVSMTEDRTRQLAARRSPIDRDGEMALIAPRRRSRRGFRRRPSLRRRVGIGARTPGYAADMLESWLWHRPERYEPDTGPQDRARRRGARVALERAISRL
jgi:DNA-binding winged helix-turn-helix (wHTH) protein